MANLDAIIEVFGEYQGYLNTEQELREEIRLVVKDIEQSAREILTVLQKMHKQDGIREIPEICSQAEELLNVVKTQYQRLAVLVSQEHYYRFHDHWRFVSQRLAFAVSLLVYLRTEEVVTKSQVAEMIGVHANREDGFHLDLEDFLMGLLSLANELSRFAVNSVTAGDYARPMRISKFVGDLHSGFKVLNLKNDSLRKRFDGLKYDVKKVEEVVYDLSIRGLKPQ